MVSATYSNSSGSNGRVKHLALSWRSLSSQRPAPCHSQGFVPRLLPGADLQAQSREPFRHEREGSLAPRLRGSFQPSEQQTPSRACPLENRPVPWPGHTSLHSAICPRGTQWLQLAATGSSRSRCFSAGRTGGPEHQARRGQG